MDFKELIEELLNTKDTTSEYSMEDIEKNLGVGIAAMVPALFWLPLVACPKSPYGRFQANQGLILLLFCIVSSILSWVVGWIPLVGFLVKLILGCFCLFLMVAGIYNALNKRVRELPFIGGLLKLL